jgi:hypothetical protein
MTVAAPARLDWDAALAYYIGLGPTRTFVAVAERFGVSDTAVRKQARVRGWASAVGEADRRAAAELQDFAIRDRVARIADTLRIIDFARTELLEQLQKGDAEVRLADLPNLARLEALFEGEATDRIELHEFHAFLARLEVDVLAPSRANTTRRSSKRSSERLTCSPTMALQTTREATYEANRGSEHAGTFASARGRLGPRRR